MEIKLEQILLKKYSNIFRTKCSEYSGKINVGNGWFTIIDKLCINIQKILNKPKNKKLKSIFEFEEIKTNFGMLFIYPNYLTIEIIALIYEAEKESENTCEFCGATGKIITVSGFKQCLCKNCRLFNKEEKNRILFEYIN